MYVYVDISTQDAPQLREATDFTAFKLVIAGGRDVGLARQALRGVAEVVDGEHAMVAADQLESLAGALAASVEWQEKFAGMLGYARSKGWVDDVAGPPHVRAHLEWQS
jgi:hypothetical protein